MSDHPYYELNGRKYPRVTNILDFRSKPWIDAWRQRVGEEAANIKVQESRRVGHMIHGVIEEINRGKHKDRRWRMPHEAVEIVTPYLDWFHDNVEEVLHVEQTVYSHEHEYAGTLDAIMKLKGHDRPTLVDLKTSRGASSSWPLQLVAYMKATEESLQLQLDNRIVVHLNKQKPYRYRVYEYHDHEGDFRKWLDVLNAYKEYRSDQLDLIMAEDWENGTGPYAEPDDLTFPLHDDDDESRSRRLLLPEPCPTAEEVEWRLQVHRLQDQSDDR